MLQSIEKRCTEEEKTPPSGHTDVPCGHSPGWPSVKIPRIETCLLHVCYTWLSRYPSEKSPNKYFRHFQGSHLLKSDAIKSVSGAIYLPWTGFPSVHLHSLRCTRIGGPQVLALAQRRRGSTLPWFVRVHLSSFASHSNLGGLEDNPRSIRDMMILIRVNST